MLIPPALVEDALGLPNVREWLEGASGRDSGRMTLEGLVSRLKDGSQQLWLVGAGPDILAVVCTDMFVEDDGSRTARVFIATGEQMHRWLHLLPELENWARAFDCRTFMLEAREGMKVPVRKMDPAYKVLHVQMVKDLTDG